MVALMSVMFSPPNSGYKMIFGKTNNGSIKMAVVAALKIAVLKISGITACLFLLPIKELTKVLIPAE